MFVHNPRINKRRSLVWYKIGYVCGWGRSRFVLTSTLFEKEVSYLSLKVVL